MQMQFANRTHQPVTSGDDYIMPGTAGFPLWQGLAMAEHTRSGKLFCREMGSGQIRIVDTG